MLDPWKKSYDTPKQHLKKKNAETLLWQQRSYSQSYGFPSSHVLMCESEVAQSCLTLCDPMDCSPPGFSVHGIFQARVLEWVAISFSRGSSWPQDRTKVSCIAGRHFTLWATREAQYSWNIKKAECRRIDAFELWYWRRLLRVPWTARRSNQSILKEINP